MLKSNSSPTIIRNKENSKKMPSNSQQFTSCSEAYPADTLAQVRGSQEGLSLRCGGCEPRLKMLRVGNLQQMTSNGQDNDS